ncbi:MAG: hypothetical protein ABIF92_02605, partial [archaeon]
FLDGDRGGDLILKSLMQLVKVEYVARAPMGFEVEELSQKDAIKALRNKITIEAAMRERHSFSHSSAPAQRFERKPFIRRDNNSRHRDSRPRDTLSRGPRRDSPSVPYELLNENVEFKPDYKVLGKIASSMAGSGNACLLKKTGTNFREVGKVPKAELSGVIRKLQNGAVQALIVDSSLDQAIINLASSKGIKYLLGHRKPYKLKRVPGMNVLEVRDIVSGIARKKVAEIPPAPAPPKTAKAADSSEKEVKSE